MKSRVNIKKALIGILIVAFLAATGYFAGPNPTTRSRQNIRLAQETYTIQYITDGDSLRFSNGAEVRLVGIDAPDFNSDPENAKRARSFLVKMLKGKSVLVMPAAEPMDKYGRNLAYLYIESPKGKNLVNALVVRTGHAYAWHYKPNTEHSAEIMKAQIEAQRERRGIWGKIPRKSSEYFVQRNGRFSITHRPGCKKLGKKRNNTVRFKNRNEALNAFGGSPPCRHCLP